jgi:hypothetical protein
MSTDRWWDVSGDEKRTPVIIDGNSHAGVHVVQLDGGLLKNWAVRRFSEPRRNLSGDIRAPLRHPAASNLLCRSM